MLPKGLSTLADEGATFLRNVILPAKYHNFPENQNHQEGNVPFRKTNHERLTVLKAYDTATRMCVYKMSGDFWQCFEILLRSSPVRNML